MLKLVLLILLKVAWQSKMSDIMANRISIRVEWHVGEGESFTPITHCATVKGPVRKILLGERVALNTIARCSGIATK